MLAASQGSTYVEEESLDQMDASGQLSKIWGLEVNLKPWLQI